MGTCLYSSHLSSSQLVQTLHQSLSASVLSSVPSRLAALGSVQIFYPRLNLLCLMHVWVMVRDAGRQSLGMSSLTVSFTWFPPTPLHSVCQLHFSCSPTQKEDRFSHLPSLVPHTSRVSLSPRSWELTSIIALSFPPRECTLPSRVCPLCSLSSTFSWCFLCCNQVV